MINSKISQSWSLKSTVSLIARSSNLATLLALILRMIVVDVNAIFFRFQNLGLLVWIHIVALTVVAFLPHFSPRTSTSPLSPTVFALELANTPGSSLVRCQAFSGHPANNWKQSIDAGVDLGISREGGGEGFSKKSWKFCQLFFRLTTLIFWALPNNYKDLSWPNFLRRRQIF